MVEGGETIHSLWSKRPIYIYIFQGCLLLVFRRENHLWIVKRLMSIQLYIESGISIRSDCIIGDHYQWDALWWFFPFFSKLKTPILGTCQNVNKEHTPKASNESWGTPSKEHLNILRSAGMGFTSNDSNEMLHVNGHVVPICYLLAS